MGCNVGFWIQGLGSYGFGLSFLAFGLAVLAGLRARSCYPEVLMFWLCSLGVCRREEAQECKPMKLEHKSDLILPRHTILYVLTNRLCMYAALVSFFPFVHLYTCASQKA